MFNSHCDFFQNAKTSVLNIVFIFFMKNVISCFNSSDFRLICDMDVFLTHFVRFTQIFNTILSTN